MIGAAQLTDDIVADAINGSASAAATIATTLEPQVRLMVTARLSSTPDRFNAIDDIVQLVMMGLGGNITRITIPTVGGLKAYVSRIVSNKVADHIRRPPAETARTGVRSLDSAIDAFSNAGPIAQFLSDGGTSPLSAIARRDEFNRIMHELGQLRKPERELITLAFFDQLSTAQIAEIHGITRPAASMRLIRAIETLRRNVTGSSQIHHPHDETN